MPTMHAISRCGANEIGSTALVRPLFSCADEADLPRVPLLSLHEYLVGALAEQLIDWPRAVRPPLLYLHGLNGFTDSNTGASDYGPGGGSGAARMTRQVLREESGSRTVCRLSLPSGLPSNQSPAVTTTHSRSSLVSCLKVGWLGSSLRTSTSRPLSPHNQARCRSPASCASQGGSRLRIVLRTTQACYMRKP